MPEEHVSEVDGEPLYSCPMALMDDEAFGALEMWSWIESGFLPRAGGIDDQLNRELELISIVQSERQQKGKEA